MADDAALWKTYWSSKEEVDFGDDKFCIYKAGSHPDKATFVLLHGAGHTSLSWSLTARALAASYNVLAIDLPCHGYTRCADESDWTLDRFARDVLRVCAAAVTGCFVLVGHSFGGAVAAHAAAQTPVVPNLLGLSIIDVVEGTALSALPHMRSVLASIPPSFNSLSEAVAWSTSSGRIRNADSAAVSIPPQLVKSNSKFVWRELPSPCHAPPPSRSSGAFPPRNPNLTQPPGTDLSASEQHWQSWYRGLSNKFLSFKGTRLLVLAGTDRLDKELMIGQMQGKFQMVVLPASGHCVMEDQPDLTAKTLSDFASRCYAPHLTAQRAAALKYFLRYRFGEPILVKGVVAHLPGS